MNQLIQLMDSDITSILTDQFKEMLLKNQGHHSFWIAEPSRQDIIARENILRSAISRIWSTSGRLRLTRQTTKVLKKLYHMSKRSEACDGEEVAFRREGYVTLITSKQRLFTRQDDEVSTLVHDRSSLGSKLVIFNLSPDATEADIVPVLEQFGTLTTVRLPLDPRTKQGRGHAFVTFSRMEEAAAAAKSLKGSVLRGLLTEPSRRLFVRHIPRNKDAGEVQRMFRQMLPGLVKITIGTSLTRVRADVKNVGYAFLEFQNPRYAKLCKTIISIMQMLGSDLAADWADPLNPEYHICDASGDE